MSKFKKMMFFLLIILFIILSVIYKTNNNYIELTNKIYFKKSLLNINNSDTKTGWFKVFSNKENQINFEKKKYKAFCNSKTLFLSEIRQYDINNKLINKEKNNHNISAHYLAYVNGEIYFNALCEK